MQDVANFIGELGGDSWTTQAVSVVLAGMGASAAAGLTAWVAISQGRKTRAHAWELHTKESQAKSREHWWDRFEWAADKVLGQEESERIAGAEILRQLATMSWMDRGDRIMTTSVLKQARSNVDTSSLQESNQA